MQTFFIAVVNVGKFFFYGKFVFQAGSPYVNQAVLCMSLANTNIEKDTIAVAKTSDSW